MPQPLRIEVAYARAERQLLRALEVAAGTTLIEAVRQSGILQEFPEIDPARASFGVFGRIRPADTVLQEGDRVEIYRPLLADPKEARRRRARRD